MKSVMSRVVMSAALISTVFAVEGEAQLDPLFDIQGPAGGPINTYPPWLFGQWEGPYDLVTPMLADGLVGEIAHAIYLPDGVFAGQIMFWNWPLVDDGSDYNPRCFIWDPEARDPLALTAVPFGTALDGSQELFCAGHVPLANGDIFAAGGRDFETGGVLDPDKPTIGTDDVFVFKLATGEWEPMTADGTPTGNPLLPRPYFYPSIVRGPNGLIPIMGNTDLQSWPTGEDPAQWRQTFDGNTGLMLAERRNDWIADSGDCAQPGELRIWDYAKITMLHDGQLMWIDGEFRVAQNDERHVSWFLDILNENCSASASEKWKWRVGMVTPHASDHAAGNAVHFVLRDGPGSGGTWDLVYNMAGTVHGDDDSNGCSDPILDMVERFEYDSLLADPWDVSWQEDAIPLRRGRKNANSVILLDGSILTVGGVGWDASGTQCEGVVRPDLLRTPQVLGSTADPQWRLMAPQQHVRTYHSTALLLPDGRVISAGGQSLFVGGNSRSVEIYRPPYFFRSQRPKITAAPPSAGLDIVFDVSVELPAGGDVARVALLATGAATHAYDWNQRYIDLAFEIDATIPGPPITQALKVSTPVSQNVCPEGYYYLCAIDGEDIPSIAEIIRIGP